MTAVHPFWTEICDHNQKRKGTTNGNLGTFCLNLSSVTMKQDKKEKGTKPKTSTEIHLCPSFYLALITFNHNWEVDIRCFCTEMFSKAMFALFPSHIVDHKTLQLTVNYVDLICPHVPSSYLHDLTILWGQHWTKMSISCGILSSRHQMICGQLKHPKLFQPQNNSRVRILFSNYTNIDFMHHVRINVLR